MEIALIVWLGIVTLVLLAAVRQIGVLSLQAKANLFSGQDPLDDGIEMGESLPLELVDTFAEADPSKPWFAVILSSTCSTCFDIAFNLSDEDFDSPFAILLAGKPEEISGILPELPKRATVITDPGASEIVKSSLNLSTVPFVFEFRENKLVAKAAIKSSDHLKRFVSEAESVTNEDFKSRQQDQETINRERLPLATEGII